MGRPGARQVVRPVYAFDRLVIPAGAEVVGQITKIDGISPMSRALAIMNADLTPVHKVEAEFNDSCSRVANTSDCTLLSRQVSDKLSSSCPATKKRKKKTVKGAASEKTREAKEQAKRE